LFTLLSEGIGFRDTPGLRAGMVLSQVRLGEKEPVNWQTGEQPGVSESRALGKTNDPETVFPSAFFFSEV